MTDATQRDNVIVSRDSSYSNPPMGRGNYGYTFAYKGFTEGDGSQAQDRYTEYGYDSVSHAQEGLTEVIVERGLDPRAVREAQISLRIRHLEVTAVGP